MFFLTYITGVVEVNLSYLYVTTRVPTKIQVRLTEAVLIIVDVESSSQSLKSLTNTGK